MAIDTSTLTPEQLERYNRYVQKYGADSKVVRTYEQKLSETLPGAPELKPAPEFFGQPTTQADIEASAEKAVEQRTLEIMAKGGPAMTHPRARALARQEAQARLQVPRTPAMVERAAAERKPIEEMTTPELFVEGLKPQVLVPAEEIKEAEAFEGEARQVRSEIEGQLRGQVLREFGRAPANQEEIRQIKETTDERILTFLQGYRQVIRDEATQVQMREQGKKQAELILEDYQDIEERTEKEFRAWAQAVFPEYEKGVKEERPAIPEEPTTYLRAAGEFLTLPEEGTFGEAMAERAQAAFTEEAPSGAIVESPGGTAMRNVAGLIRPVTEPLFQAFTYDVDEKGNPVDPDDWNYKAAQEYDQMLEDWYSGDPLEANSRLEDVIIAAKGIISAKADRTDIDDYEKPFQSSGNLVRDIAIANMQARFLGDDLMDVPVTTEAFKKLGWQNGPWWIGMGAEIGMPITPIPVGQAALKGVAGTERALGEAAVRLAEKGVAGTTAARTAALGYPGMDRASRALTMFQETAEATQRGAQQFKDAMDLGADAATAAAHPVRSARNLMAANELRAAHAEILNAVRAAEFGPGSKTELIMRFEPDVLKHFTPDELLRLPANELEEILFATQMARMSARGMQNMTGAQISSHFAKMQVEEIAQSLQKYAHVEPVKALQGRTWRGYIRDAARANDVLANRVVNDIIKAGEDFIGTGAERTFINELLEAGKRSPVIRAVAGEYDELNKLIRRIENMAVRPGGAAKLSEYILDGRISDEVLSAYAIAAQRGAMLFERLGYEVPGLSRVVDDMLERIKRFDPAVLEGMSTPAKLRLMRETLGFDMARIGLGTPAVTKAVLEDIMTRTPFKPSRMALTDDFVRAIQTNVRKEATRIILTERLGEKMVEMFPNDLVMLTPTMVIRKQAYDEGRKRFQQMAQRELAATRTPEGDFQFKNAKNVATMVIREIGPKGAVDSEAWHRLLGKLLRGEALDQAEYTMAHGVALNNVARRAFPEAVRLRKAGRAYARARVPEVRRLEPFRAAQDIARFVPGELARVVSGKEVFNGIRKGLKATEKFVGNLGFPKGPYARIELKQLEAELQAVMSNSVREMKRKLQELRRLGLSKQDAFNQVFRESMPELPFPTDKFYNKQNWVIKAQQYTDIIKIFFDAPERGVSVSEDIIQDAFQRLIDEGVIRVDGDYTLNEVIQTIKKIRELQPSYVKEGLKGAFGGDEIMAAVLTQMMRNQRAAKIDEVVNSFIQRHPDVFVQPGLATNFAEGSFAQMMSAALRGKERRLLEIMLQETFTRGRLDPEDLVHAVFQKSWKEVPQHIRKDMLTDWISQALTTVEKRMATFQDDLERARDLLVKKQEELRSIPEPPDAPDPLDVFRMGTKVGPPLTAKDIIRKMARQNLQREIDALAGEISTIKQRIKSTSAAIRSLMEITERPGALDALIENPQEALRLNLIQNPEVVRGLQSSMRNVLEPLAYDFDRMMNKMGFRHAGPKVKVPEILSIPAMQNQVVGALTDAETRQTLQTLIDAQKTGVLQENLQAMRARGFEKWFFGSLRAINRAAVGGLLGGFPLPNARFHSNNIFSAPFITQITSPGYTLAAIRSIPEQFTSVIGGFAEAFPQVKTLQQVNELLNDVSRVGVNFKNMDPTDVVFTDKYGKQWTKQMAEEAIARNELGMSQATFEFGDKALKELERAAGMAKTGQEAKWYEQMMRYMRPDEKNVWNIWAEEADQVLRKNIFLTSLKRGMTEADAAALARASLLDYGAIPAWERKTLGRYAMFYAFQRKMAEDTLLAFARPRSADNLARQIRFIQAQHKQAGTLYNEPDWLKNRAWAWYSDTTEDELYKTAFGGQQLPGVEAFIMLSNAFDVVANDLLIGSSGRSGQEIIGDKLDQITEGARRRVLTNPAAAFLWDVNTKYNKYPESAPHGYVPAKYILAWKRTGMWEIAKDKFRIEPVPAGKEIPGEPTFEGKQWRFRDGGGRRGFKLFELGSLLSGTQRNVLDYSMALTRAGWDLDDAELKRYEDGSWWMSGIMYQGMLQNPYKLPDEVAMQLELNRQINKEMRGMAKE